VGLPDRYLALRVQKEVEKGEKIGIIEDVR
jgi:hypothetical protein